MLGIKSDRSQPSLHILLIEDDEDDYMTTHEMLREWQEYDITVKWVANRASAKEALSHRQHDIIFLDYQLGSCTGIELLHDIRASGDRSPIFLMTAHEGAMELEAAKAGAWDYLVKGQYTSSELIRSIRYTLERQRTEAERQALHDQVIEISHQLGMAEISKTILHNVSNILNSVEISVSLLLETSQNSHVEDLASMANMLQAHASNLGDFLVANPKGQLLPEYFDKLAHALTQEHALILRELMTLHANVDHIKHIIHTQQHLAKPPATTDEPVELSSLLEQALLINNQTEFEKYHIDIVREYQPCPPVSFQTHKILQILVNLIRNAKHSMQTIPRDNHRLTLRINLSPDRDHAFQIQIRDSGIGIKPEHHATLFSQGFTTKPGGQGIGLSSSALAVQAMAGSLTAHSDGDGQGATFILDLPFKYSQGKDTAS